MLGNRELTYLPHWLCDWATLIYFVAFGLCTLLFSPYPMPPQFALVSIITVLSFFLIGRALSVRWTLIDERRFIIAVIFLGIFIRLCFAIYMYYFNLDHYGEAYGNKGDVEGYIGAGLDCAEHIRNGDWKIYALLRSGKWMCAIDDTGYPIVLCIEYLLINSVSTVFWPFILKSILGGLCAIFIYNIASRHFGKGVARIAAFFIVFNPNLIYWCGSMMKETEMTFLCCWFVDRMDYVLNGPQKITIGGVLPVAIIGLSLFLFRSALGLTAFLAVLLNIVLSSGKVMSFAKKIIAGLFVIGVLFIGMGENIQNQTRNVVSQVSSNSQKGNMEWRANRVDKAGNKQKFARYASATVFAPLIFTIPFPTFNVANAEQIVQLQTSGGSYIKNILSYFVILSLFILLLSGEWRQHVFIIAYMCGYLGALVLSGYAQSGRFHMPIFPMLMLFAAYGVSLAHNNPKFKRWFNYVLFVEVLACIAWNWFKLAGRGLI